MHINFWWWAGSMDSLGIQTSYRYIVICWCMFSHVSKSMSSYFISTWLVKPSRSSHEFSFSFFPFLWLLRFIIGLTFGNDSPVYQIFETVTFTLCCIESAGLLYRPFWTASLRIWLSCWIFLGQFLSCSLTLWHILLLISLVI